MPHPPIAAYAPIPASVPIPASPPIPAAASTDAVSPRLVLSSLWTAMLFVFAYVDIFGFWRADVIRGALAAAVPNTSFTINQAFLTLTTAYILVPALMVAGSTLLPRRVLRPLTLVLAVLYAASIVASAVNEPWTYFRVGSAVEVALLIVIAREAWRWQPIPTRVPAGRSA